MEYLLQRLIENTEHYINSLDLFTSFRTAVINHSSNGQIPQFGEIGQTGAQGGEFIFMRVTNK